MQTTRVLRGPSDRTINRAIKALALLLLIGIPLIAVIYWSDRHADSTPTVAERAVTAAEANVKAKPSDVGVRNNLAAAYVSAKRYDEGITQFGEALKLDPANRAALLGRGIAYLAEDKLDLAKTDFEKLVGQNADAEMAGSDPQLEQAYYELGAIAMSEGRPADAATLEESALKIDGGDADALNTLGQALIATGDPTKGVAALRTAVQFVPTGWCEPYQGLVDGYGKLANADGVAYAKGMVAFCQGQLAEATTDLKPLVGGSMNIDALLGLAVVAAQQGDAATATGYYQQVLVVDPNNASASIGIGQLGGINAHNGIPAASQAPAGNN